MSFGRLEEKIRKDALLEGPARARELLRELEALEAEAVAAGGEQAKHSFAGAASSWSSSHRGEFEYLTELGRFAPDDRELSVNVAALHRLEEAQQQQIQRASPSQMPAPLLSVKHVPSASRPGEESVGAVAKFLDIREDDVRLRAARRELIFDLGHSRVFDAASLGGDGLVAVRSIALARSWGAEDDENAIDPDLPRLLALNNDLECVVAAYRDLEDLVASSREPVTQVEERMAQAATDTAAGVQRLTEAYRDRHQFQRNVLLPAIAILAGFAIPVCPAAGIGGALAIKAALAAGLATGTVATRRKLESWQARGWQIMQEQLPKAFEPLSLDESQLLCDCGDQAERRLLDAAAGNGWRRMILCPKVIAASIAAGVRLWMMYRESNFRQSGSRRNGNAYRITFDAPLDAADAFRVVHRMHIGGSLDGWCDVCWNCPVRVNGCETAGKASFVSAAASSAAASSSTSVRFSILSNMFFNRDFFLVCRTGLLSSQSSAGDKEHVRRFGITMCSLPEDKLGGRALPKPASNIEHGRMYVGGVLVEDIPGPVPRCKVSVVADLDPSAPDMLSNDGVIDIDVRMQLLATVKRLLQEFKLDAKRPYPAKGDS